MRTCWNSTSFGGSKKNSVSSRPNRTRRASARWAPCWRRTACSVRRACRPARRRVRRSRPRAGRAPRPRAARPAARRGAAKKSIGGGESGRGTVGLLGAAHGSGIRGQNAVAGLPGFHVETGRRGLDAKLPHGEHVYVRAAHDVRRWGSSACGCRPIRPRRCVEARATAG